MAQIKPFPGFLGSLLIRILAAIAAGVLLLCAVRLLPAEPMDRNLEASAPVFAEEGIYPDLFPWCTSQLDSTTDALILLISACDTGEDVLTQAMSGTWNTLSSREAPSDQLAAHYGDGIPFDGSEPYYQYWHGYQLIIRPLLSLLSYSGIRILNGILQTGLLLVLCLLLYRRGLGSYILPYAAAVAMLMPPVLAMSLQYSSCYYILTLGSIAVVSRRGSPDRKDAWLFLYLGIATAYFDFLTYPVATLGIPAVLYFCIHGCTSIRDTFCRGVRICFSWGVGYLGMWAGKWVAGSLLLQKNILAVASDKLTERSGAETSLLTGIRAALSANLRAFLRTPVTAAVVLLALVLILRLALRLREEPGKLRRAACSLFPFVILALLPIAWYIVTSQHAVIHYWFTNKALAVSVLAGLAGLAAANARLREI